MTSAAAAGHVLITGVVGLIVALAGQEMAGALEGGERLGGGILIAFGLAYAVLDLRHLGHRHVHHVHDGEVHDAGHHAVALGDRAAIGSLVLLLSVSPCIALAPIFYKAGGSAGVRGAVAIAILNALVTVPVMTAMALLAGRGLALARLERFERRERVVVGLVLVALGVAVIVLHHEHPS